MQTLKQKPEIINVKLLEQCPEFLEFKTKSNTKSTTADIDTTVPTEERTPREVMEDAYVTLRSGLVDELLEQVMQGSPSFFERLVVDLLVRMGYGGTRKEAGKAVGESGDEGIYGIINEDRLGLEVVYIQAKRWQGTVGRPEIQKFEIMQEIKASDKGGKPGQWSAHKSQLLVKEYEKAGGGYKGEKGEDQKHLKRWTEEEWQTREGEAKAREGDETKRYLPKEAWEKLSPEEREATEKAKRQGSKKGEQHVGNTEAVKEARK